MLETEVYGCAEVAESFFTHLYCSKIELLLPDDAWEKLEKRWFFSGGYVLCTCPCQIQGFGDLQGIENPGTQDYKMLSIKPFIGFWCGSLTFKMTPQATSTVITIQ